MQSIYPDNYEIVKDINVGISAPKLLLLDKATGEKFIGYTVKNENIDAIKQLIGKKHENLPCIHEVSETTDGDFVVIEEYYEGISLKDRLTSVDIDEGDFEDYMLQLCEALEFLSKQKWPMYYRKINADNIIIGEDNAIKLINLENVSYEGSLADSLKQVGALMRSFNKKFLKKYKRFIRRCEDKDTYEYEYFHELYHDISRAARSFLIRRSATIALVLGIILVVARMSARIVPNFFK